MQFIDLQAQYKSIESKILKRINGVLNHGQYIMGPEVSELESELSEYVGVKHSIGCANGTDALSIALKALNIGEGDEVISTPFTFFATGETIAMAGAKLVFADIDPNTYNINAELIEEKITAKTKAIIPVSLYGQMSDMDKIMEIAKKHNLYVIEDAAQSFGAEIQGRKSCSIADISTTSFFPAKPLGCYGDGGAIFTNNDDLAKSIAEIRNHGQSKRYTHTSLGYNSRLDTLQAAILLEKLSVFPKEVELRQTVAMRYEEHFKGKIKTTRIKEGYKSVFAQYTIEVENRDSFIEKMKQDGIPTAVHYPVPIHHQPIFQKLGYGKIDMPLADIASQKVVSLPMHPYMENADQDKVIKAVLKNI
ncbi:MAG: aminotransferase DegT [Halobacteriovoraceae bacterium]|nr:aminotransferase DegT [Halobacteriovoraceae bacterium]|tara:strand:+ start:13457 stop:14545 length:1089 start_codon:yes stop_codon:yes gene_type:complete